MTSMNKISNTSYNKMMKEYDVNGDGKLDQKDVKSLEQSGAVVSKAKSIAALFTGGLSTIFTGTGSDDSRKAERLKGLLARDGNGCINTDDIEQPSSRSSYGNDKVITCGIEQPDLITSYITQKKLKDIKTAKAKDLQNVGKSWDSDNMAQELILDNPRCLKGLPLQEKAFLLSTLRDSGSGKYVHITKKDRQAMLTLLESATPKERAILLDMAGGREAFSKHMKGADLNKFNALCGSAPATSKQKMGSIGNTDPLAKSNRPETSVKPPLGDRSNSSGRTSGTTSGSRTSAPTQTQSAGNDGDMFGSMKEDLRQRSSKVQDLLTQYKNCKSPEDKKMLQVELQMAMQSEKELFSLMTSILKQQHDMSMSAIRKM